MEIAMRTDMTLREEYLLKIWDNYIHDNVVQGTPCSAAIYDARTRRLIVASDRFHLLDNELYNITEGMKYPETVYRDGITVQNRHYDVRLADGKNGIYATDGVDGCTVCKTNTLIIVGVHDSRVLSAQCNEQIMRLGDYFRKLGL
ncbi:uncharacterized protein LOC128213679 [Mya arenaria]|uniref:uncharacterized protein LOC128213679 n=1 Tax=Mya arenaria TaxID=6604 RepID=UPI0022E470FF|nr:uncharacterized protein LOC128213679 [Mya arenaria]